MISSEIGFSEGFDTYMEYCSYGNTEFPTHSWSHENDTETTFHDAIEWLGENAKKKFFLFLHTYECHTPYEGTYFLSEDVKGSVIEHRKALYDGDIRVADSYFGELMQAIDSLGLRSKTIVIFLSDHGDEFYDHYRESDRIPPIPKEHVVPQFNRLDHDHSVYDELVHVPCIIHIPSLEPSHRVVDSQIRLIDIMPTILELVGIEADNVIHGVSALDLILTGGRTEDPPALMQLTSGPERKAIRKDGYKYIWIENPEGTDRFGITFRNLRQYELFDLRKDPGEKNNIYEENKELAEEYHRIMKKELEDSTAFYDRLRIKSERIENQPGEISEDVIDSLKALGYL